jgi:hypothetical protein
LEVFISSALAIKTIGQPHPAVHQIAAAPVPEILNPASYVKLAKKKWLTA